MIFPSHKLLSLYHLAITNFKSVKFGHNFEILVSIYSFNLNWIEKHMYKGLFGCAFEEIKSAFNNSKSPFEEKSVRLVKKNLKTLLTVQKAKKMAKTYFCQKVTNEAFVKKCFLA
jgi:hypothetical protein